MLALCAGTAAINAQMLTSAEREKAEAYLKSTAQTFKESFNGLSDAQLNWSPSPEAWSVGDCVKHLAASEGGLRQMVDGFLAAPANPEKRAEIKATDEQMMAMMASREVKVKTFAPLEPKNTSYTSVNAAWEDFETRRKNLVEWMENTDQPLRSHVGQIPTGMLDAYQLSLLIGAHTLRHTAQIEEIKANPNFPKN